MKSPIPLLISACALLLSACTQLELAPPVTDPNRVLTGFVDFTDGFPLPSDTTVVVRVVDASAPGMPPKILGDQVIKNPGSPPVAFRVEYQADDDLLRHGLNVEARISYNGKVRFYNLNHFTVTPGNAGDPHHVWVDKAP